MSVETNRDAARQALRWVHALAGPGRQQGASMIPCTGDKKPVFGWKWAGEHEPGFEQSEERVCEALRLAERTETWALAPASDGLVVLDVDDMRYLPRALADFGPTPVYMRTRSGRVHLYYAGPAVRSHPNLWGTGPEKSVEVKCRGAMVHVAGPGYVPSHALPAALTDANRGWLRGSLPPFRADVLAEILAQKDGRAAACDPGYDRFATTPTQIERLRRYMTAAGSAKSGNAGHDHTFRLLRKIGDLGANEDLALDLALEWDEGNEPPWGPVDIRKKVRDAYRTRHNSIGWRMRDDDDDLELADDDDDLADDAELRRMLAEVVGRG